MGGQGVKQILSQDIRTFVRLSGCVGVEYRYSERMNTCPPASTETDHARYAEKRDL